MLGTSQWTSQATKVFGGTPGVVVGAVVTAALAFPLSANAQQLPWLAAPSQGAPSAVTTVPKTPLNRAVPGSRYVPDVQAPPPQAMPAPQAAPAPQTMPPGYAPAATAPSPVMPVPNAPIGPAHQAPPYAQPAPAMRPALAPEPAPAVPVVPGVPAWLNPHIGDGEGQISATVLKRAHDFHRTKVRAGAVKNSCYFAFDATRPGDGAKRFYVICENNGLFRAVSSGHGAGRNFPGIADLSNNTQCAKNFSNARNSHLTTGGGYVTAEVRTSFKGYYHDDDGYQPLMRSFLQYEGEGETATARVRAIGGHSAAIVRWQCRMKMPSSKYADSGGYVPYGKLVDYSAGRSSGCTSWPREINETILGIVKNQPTTVYVYPEAKDIVAVGRAVRAGQSLSRAGLYWSAACLREIGAPNFWPREKLEPALLLLAKKSSGRPRTLSDLPVCKKTVVGSAR
ncbi:murein L,D-transpeptidase catalytic domain family protein [Methyloceanibacter methanicus]|uniref:murein L,D-transpeptidase catalytic domain family protein n=1 Tax=Methyloceanibacter methanicus TaxID=1774968 RepID=UPI000849B5EF|nr:murein L,D-transpeptidase catalytic domain family protein [Methyloceanibacter methanicus]